MERRVQQTVMRTYSIADLCGNTATCAQIITVNDTVPPTLLCSTAPALATCDASEIPVITSLDTFILMGGLASDNCGLDSASFTLLSEVSDGETCPETVTRTYGIADSCGNTTSCTQTIIVDDTIAPLVTCPGDTITECAAADIVPYATFTEFIAGGGSATDNCALDSTSFSLVSEVSDGETCPETVTRTYSIADLCGNTGSCTQIITVRDFTPPQMLCPGDTTAACDASEVVPFADLDAFITAGGSASDNCEP